MEMVWDIGPPGIWAIAVGVALLAGLVKGVVGFAMPMVLISGLGTVVSPELALAGLIMPTLVTNGWQALRQGPRAALASIRRFRVFLLAGMVCLAVSAQLFRILPEAALLVLIGVPVTAFALIQLAGVPMRLPGRPRPATEAAVGGFAGFVGGVSGVWGPPTVALLTALDTPKVEQMRVQGVIYGLGAVALMVAHLGSGVLRADTLPLSLALVLPALAGMAAGFAIQDRIDQRAFRRATLAVLLIAGLNLLRRALVA
ncbi:sulfite exporter TauE/SafE family protein [Roseovarius salinarum]|uniref:sulfite exporter TauE/SafE family protein n=1 Tax=Roseovarius salinarum TaxID=1981892 RepID=UPI000C34D669|nr:sulfite exporter TauE/SafE family protein [Roseovarius salinarum]